MGWSFRSAMIFVLGGLSVLVALNAAGRWSPGESSAPQRMASAYENARGARAVSLGASIGTAISFEAMCLDGAPFFYPNQDIFEVEALTHLFLSQPAPPDYFFIALLPTSLQQDNGSRAAGTSRRRSTYRFLHDLDRWELIESDWREALLAEVMPAIGRDLRLPWQNEVRRFLWTGADQRDVGAKNVDPFDRASAVAEARQYVKDRGAELDRFSYADPHVAEKTSAALQRMLNAIQANGSTMIIVVTPVTRPLREEMAGQQWGETAEFEEVLRQLETEGAVIANYFHGSPEISEFDHFRDNHHLNAAGTAAFSRQLGRELREHGIIPPVSCEVRLPEQG